jgi:hypothetical protein
MGEYLKRPRGYEAGAAMKRQLARVLGKGGVEIGMVLSRWYTNEVSGYRSAGLNLPAVGERVSPAGRRAIRAAVKPLLTLGERYDFALMAAGWAGEIAAYCHLLSWWGKAVARLCEGGARDIAPAAIRPPPGYGYALPASLLDYLERLFAATTRGR